MQEPRGRTLPFSEASEKYLLASIFLDPRLAVEAIDKLKPEDFYVPQNKKIFEAMRNITAQDDLQIDVVTVTEYFMSDPTLQSAPVDYINELANLVPSPANFEKYINLISDASLKRQLITLSSEISEQGLNENIKAIDYLDRAEERIFALSQKRRATEFVPIGEVAKEYQKITEENKRRGGKITGIDTGYDNLNDITAGLHAEELVILASRPGMGKSTFAFNLALKVAQPRKNISRHVAIFSLEMSNQQIVGKMLSNLAAIQSNKLRVGDLTPDEWRKLDFAVNELNSYNIYFDDAPGTTIPEIRAKCRKLKQQGKLDFVIIDYLQLITTDQRVPNRSEEVSKISRGLKRLAKELQIPVLALSQLSREIERREDKVPVLADLRESGSIEQDADIVMFLHRPEYYNKNRDKTPSGEADLIIAKNRHGSLGKLNFRADFAQSRFSARETRFDENE